jgi:ATP-dependent DNA helicase RecG
LHQSALRERPAVNYPRVALRELLMNAVRTGHAGPTHQSAFISSKTGFEIQSPGGLYIARRRRRISPFKNSYRDPVLAEAMKALGFVNRFGRRVLRAQEAWSKTVAARLNSNLMQDVLADSSVHMRTIAFFNNK